MPTPQQLYAELYDAAVPDWPGEIDFCPDALYLRMTGQRPEQLFPVLGDRLSHA